MNWRKPFSLEHRWLGPIYADRNASRFFVRISPFHWLTLGLMLGWCNYLKGKGIEVALDPHRLHWLAFRIGWTNPKNGWWPTRWGYLRPHIDWSGSLVEPRYAWTVRLLGFGFGMNTPKWLQREMSRRDERELRAMQLGMAFLERNAIGHVAYYNQQLDELNEDEDWERQNQ